MNSRGGFLAVWISLLTAFTSFGAGRTEFGLSDMYTLTAAGERKPIPGSLVTDGFAAIPPDVPFHIELKDVDPGAYYVSVRARFSLSPGCIENFIRFSEMYVNGRRVNYIRARVPEEGDTVEWLEHDKVELKDGDIITLTGRYGETVSDVMITRERLSDDIVRRYDEPSDRETYIADLGESRLTPDGLLVRVLNRTGRVQKGELSVRVTDYWGEVILSKVESMELCGSIEKGFKFPVNATGETRATVVWTQADGLFARKYLAASHDVMAGVRKRMVFETGWTSCARYDDGSYDSRRVRDDVPTDAVWRETPLPALIVADSEGRKPSTAYFRNKLVVPTAFKGSRIVFSAERVRSRARLFVNGRFVREASDSELELPFETDITDWLNDGPNDILLVVHGYCSAFRDDDLKTVGNLDRSLEYMPARHAISLCEVTVMARPAMCLGKSPFITTSVSKKAITVRTEDVPTGCTVSHRVLHRGRPLLCTLKDGVETPFPNAPLWGPLEFPLLQLETTLKDASDRTVDVLSTRFGFREFSTRGADLLWNGHPYRGVSRPMGGFNCLDREKNGSRQRLLDGINLMRLEGSRFITHTDQPHVLYDFCDELGIPVKVETPYGAAGQMEARFLDNPRFWEGKKASARRMVDIYGMHPSIFCLSPCGEFWTLNDDRAFRLVKPCIEDLQAYDPTRFVEAESDADCRGLTGISSTHYPMPGSSRAEDMWYPDQFYFRPLDVAFTNGMAIPCGQCKDIGNCHGDGLLTYGTKPILANETGWVVNIGRPHATTAFYGEEGYQGFNTLEAHHVNVNRETYYGQRDMGMTQIGDWRALSSDRLNDIAPNFDIQPVERYHSFYEGTEVSFQVNVFHDVLKAETLDITWRLVGANDETMASGATPCFLDWCKGARTSIRFTAPKAGRYRLSFGAEGLLVRTLPITTYSRLGDEASLLKADCIVAGEDPVTPEMLAKVERGGVLFLLPRERYPEELPVKLQPTQRNASLCLTFRPGHPLLEGVSARDLSLWYPKHVCGFGFFDKPVSGLAKTIVEAGGPAGFKYSALVEIPYGKGVVYATRLLLKPEENPIAAKILRNAIAVKPTRAAGKLGLVGSSFAKHLREWGVDVEQVKVENLVDGTRNASDFPALFVDGTDAKAAAFLKSGKTAFPLVFVQNPDAKLWGVKINRQLPKSFNGSAIKLSKNPKFLDGLTNTDFFWRKKGLGWGGENPGAVSDKSLILDPLGTAEVWGEQALVYPRFLAARGNLLFSELNLSPTNGSSKPLVERLMTTILANVGVRVSPPRPIALPRRLRYEPIDISRLLHRSFADDVDNDGKGGWADLGPDQDLREFKLPAGIHRLAGVDYRIERPNSLFVMKSRYRKQGDTLTDAVVEMNGRKAPWIFFLHSCVWEMAMPIMSVFVDYSDGSTYEIVMSGGVNLRDYAEQRPESPFFGEIDTVTKCAVTVPQVKWGSGSMFSTGWCNPWPDKRISRLRFHSMNRAAVMFAGVTVGYPLDDVADTVVVDEKRFKDLADKAVKLQQAKKYHEAIAVYEKAHQADPRQLFVMNAIGNCYDQLEKYAKAAEWYKKSLDTDINQPHVLVYYNTAMEKVKRNEKR